MVTVSTVWQIFAKWLSKWLLQDRKTIPAHGTSNSILLE
jgi:hypothetical protein